MGMSASGGSPYGPLAWPLPPSGLVSPGRFPPRIIASRWKFGRAELDEFSARSHQRAATTAASGGF